MVETVEKLYDMRETFDLVLGNINDMICIVDPNENYKIEMINQKVFQENLGYSRNELIGRSFLELISQGEGIAPISMIENALYNKEHLNEIKIKKKDGNFIWVEVKWKRTKNINAQERLLLILKDMSQIEIKETDVNNAATRFELISSYSDDFYAILNDKFEYEYINDRVYKESLGFDKDEIVGKTALNIIYPDDIKKAVRGLRKSFETGENSTDIRVRTKNGGYIWVETKGRIFTDDDGNKKALLTGRDVTARKEAQQKLKESEEKYRFITENINDTISLFGEDFKLKFINETQERISGFTEKEVMGKSPLDFLHPNDIKRAAGVFKRTLKDGEGRGEFRMRSKDNSYKWMSVNGRVTHDSEGKPLILLVSRDVTKEKESEEKYQNLIDNLTDIILELDMKGMVTFVSPQCIEVIGFKPDELVGKSAFNLIHSDDVSILAEAMKKAFQTKKTISVPKYRLIHKNGIEIFASAQGKMVNINGNDKFIGTIRDISTRVETEQKLKESEEKYRLITEKIPNLLSIYDEKMKLEYMNYEQHTKILGYNKDELSNLNYLTVLHPDDMEKIKTMFLDGFKTGKGASSSPFRFKHKDGHWVWLDGIGRMFNDKNGEIRALIIGQDITKQIEAEKEFKDSENKYRSLFENSPNAILLIDTNGIILDCNSTSEKLSEFKKTDLIGQSFMKVAGILEEFLPTVLEKMKLLLKGENVELQGIQLCTKSGGRKWVVVQGSLVELGDENIMQVIIQDISEKKEAEIEIEASRKKLEIYVDSMMDGFCINDSIGTIVQINDAFVEMLGYKSSEQIIGRKIFDLVSKEEVPGMTKRFTETIKNKESGIKNYEVECLRKDNSEFTGSFNIRNLWEDEKYVGSISIVRDITEKNLAAQRLKESEESYRILFNKSPVGITISNSKNEIILMNNKIEEITGYSKEELNILNLESIYIDSKQHSEIFEIMATQGMIQDHEVKIRHKDGTEKTCLLNVDRHEISDATIFQTTLQDITKRKESEKKLRISEERLSAFKEAAPMSFALFDSEFNIVDVNQNTLSRLPPDTTKEDVLGKHLTEFAPNAKETGRFDKYMEVMKTGKPFYSDDVTVHPQYGNISLELRAFKVGDGMGFIIIDNTERKLIEQKLKESEKRYRGIFEKSPTSLWHEDFSEIKIYFEDLKKKEIHDFNAYFKENPDEVKKCAMMVKVIDINRKTIEIYKAQSKESFYNGLSQVFTEESYDMFKNEIVTFIGGNTRFESEALNNTFEDEPLYIYIVAEIVPGHEEDWSEVLISIIDITDRKRIEQKLIESEETYRRREENLIDIIIEMNIDGKVIYISPQVFDILGYKEEELIETNGYNIVFPDDIPQIQERTMESYEQNNPIYFEFRAKHKDGHYIPMSARGNIVIADNIPKIVGIMKDDSEKKETEIKLKLSEEKYRNLFDSSPNAIILMGRNGKIQDCNLTTEIMLGYKKEELIGENYMELQAFSPTVRPKERIKVMDANKQIHNPVEIQVKRKDGSPAWITAQTSNIKIGDKKFFQIIIQDITEKRKYEELISELNMNFLTFTADIQSNIHLLLNTCCSLLNGELALYVNKTKRDEIEQYEVITSDKRMFTYNAGDFEKSIHVSEFFREEHDYSQVLQNVNDTKYAATDHFIQDHSIKGSYGKLIKIKTEYDGLLCVLFQENPSIGHQDDLVMFLICDAIEIEQRRWEAKEKLEAQNKALSEISKLKSDLLSRTSHELKTPLISIKGFTELLMTRHGNKLDSDMVSILDEIKDGSKRLERIIHSLLQSSKLEQGKVVLSSSQEDLSFLINFCVKEVDSLAVLREQTIFINVQDKIIANFDKERLYDVIINLLSNAIKNTPPKGEITVFTKVKNDSVVVSVKDSGVGITEEEKNKLFKKFGKIERYGQSWDINIEGTGLGLYIAKKIVRLHGGNIWVESEGRNKGSTFSFSIPKT